MKLAFRCLLATLLSAASVASQTDPLVGRWRGTGEDNSGEIMTIRADGTAESDGERLTWRTVREGVIAVTGGGETVEMQYVVRGDGLTLSFYGDSYPFVRIGGGPVPAPQPSPRGEPGNPLGGTGNPLGGGGESAAADPFLRRFEGEGIALELRGVAPEYQGTLTFRGTDYVATARRAGNGQLAGSFLVSEQRYEFQATLEGDAMELRSGGSTYALRATTPLSANNPLAGGEPGEAGSRKAPPPPLQGVSSDRGQTWEHPRGWFSFEMPPGWTVAREVPEGIMLNPGFTETDTLDALIFLTYGDLDDASRNRSVDVLLQQNEAELLDGLRQQGIELVKAKRPPTKVSTGEVPGAVQTWTGRAQSGVRVDVWGGAIVKRDSWLVVLAILVDGKGDRFLPKVKRVFQTLRPTPPEPNVALARALVGKTFFKSTRTGVTSKSGSFSVSLTFSEGGVRKEMFFTGNAGSGLNSDQRGTYEVVGDELYMYFPDGQETGQIMVDGGQPAVLKLGGSDYVRG